MRAVGGEFKTIYLTLGNYDLVGVAEAPDDESFAKFLLSVASEGSVRTETLRAFSESEYRKIMTELP